MHTFEESYIDIYIKYQNDPIINQYSTFLVRSHKFIPLENDKQNPTIASIITRFDMGTLKILHDMKQRC